VWPRWQEADGASLPPVLAAAVAFRVAEGQELWDPGDGDRHVAIGGGRVSEFAASLEPQHAMPPVDSRAHPSAPFPTAISTALVIPAT